MPSWVKWLGTCDQIVEYFKPKQRPKWMTAEAFALRPESILVRELRYRIGPRGCRVKEVLLVARGVGFPTCPRVSYAVPGAYGPSRVQRNTRQRGSRPAS